MLTLSAQVIGVIPPSTNKRTGQIIEPSVEFLHKVFGKSEIIPVKISETVQKQWEKVVGQSVAVEVVSYAFKTDDGNVMAGFRLVDKSTLPVAGRAA